jgi:N-acetylmuramoyl-L-alanine amidase
MIRLLFLGLFFSNTLFAKVVLIDPGHGGVEIGAIGYENGKKSKKVFEKDLCLKLSKKIKDELSKNTSTYLTRSLDRAVGLQERADQADLLKADLFISVHFNSSTNPQSHGFELYYLDNNSNAAAAKVERSENLNLKGEDMIVNQILVDLVVQQTVSHSKQLAAEVHAKLRPVVRSFGIEDRGIKPGLFYVLALSKRPGLLIEVGFVSNPRELQKVRQEKFQNEFAKAVSDGVMNFIRTQK